MISLQTKILIINVHMPKWTVIGISPRTYIHTSLLLDCGATPKVVQRQLRHSDARTTLEIYGHVAHREAVEKVASVLPGLSSQTGGDSLARNYSGRRKPYPPLGLVFAPASARNLFRYSQYSLFVRATTAV